MAVFVSYSSRDRALLAGLLAGLKRAHEPVWFDEDLSGGETWWRAILDQIRNCDLFIAALSQNMLESKACQSEVKYAQALGKPILPVQVGELESTRTHPFATMQVIDYRHPSIETGIQLVTNVHASKANLQPLPDPLPAEPPIPFAYLMRLASDLAAPTLTAQEQSELVAQLKAGLEEDGDDQSARADIAQLFRQLRDRPDVTYRTRTEVDSVLATLQSDSAASQAVTQPDTPQLGGYQQEWTNPQVPIYQQPAYQQQPAYEQQPVYQAPSHEHTSPQPVYQQPPAYEPQYLGQHGTTPPPRSSRRIWLLAGAGAAVAAIVVVIVVIAMLGGSTTKTVDKSALPSFLLSTDEAKSVIGADLTAVDVVNHMDDGTDATQPCSWLTGTAIKQMYDGTGYTGVADQALSATDPKSIWVAQTVVAFDSPDQAANVVKTFDGKWKNCVGKTVTVNVSDEQRRWTFGDVTRSDSQLTQKATLEAGNGYACQHILRALSNVVIEVDVCREQVGDESNRIVDKIADKVGEKTK
jgi:serine/threonine kinase PknH